MNKRLLSVILIVSIFSSAGLFARRGSEHSEEYQAVDGLIRLGVNENFSAIQSASSDLSFNEKMELFDIHSRSGGMYAGINAYTFWGIGSFVQGDMTSGITICALNIVGSTMLSIGSIMLCASLANSMNPSYVIDSNGNRSVTYYNPNAGFQAVSTVIVIASAASLVGNYIGSIFAPLNYSKKINRQLARALNLYDSSVSVAPVFTSDNKPGAAVSVVLKI